MKVNTKDLTGMALDWFVLVCEGATNLRLKDNHIVYDLDFDGDLVTDYLANCNPSSDWGVAGPIVTRIGIDIRQLKADKSMLIDKRHFDESLGDVLETVSPSGLQMVRRPKPPHPLDGRFLARPSKGTGEMVRWDKSDFLSDEPLVAAMRCYVANTLGCELELPDLLVEVAENKTTVGDRYKPKIGH
ncbi:phage protein NinX family protein [Methylotenera sp.]|uniref:phage protein NinX family protein n=1 Tax=Methylotenera sp. TaxID=2051956 RepID=UPI0025D1F03E|nr:phage protein NinX family protein [Methylotenera sp.]